jgi:hypothetical protein
MTIRYLRLNSGDSFPAACDLSPFKAIVVVEEPVESQWQAAASRWLADSGCLYMMAWGEDCSSWDDSVDLANINQFDCDDIPDAKFIMTTWHDDESLPDVAWFAKVCAHHPTVEIENVVFLHIASADQQEEFEALYRDA